MSAEIGVKLGNLKKLDYDDVVAIYRMANEKK